MFTRDFSLRFELHSNTENVVYLSRTNEVVSNLFAVKGDEIILTKERADAGVHGKAESCDITAD